MVEASSDYGATGIFQVPSTTSTALGSVFSSVADTVATTQRNMTAVATLNQRTIPLLKRESKKKAVESIDFDKIKQEEHASSTKKIDLGSRIPWSSPHQRWPKLSPTSHTGRRVANQSFATCKECTSGMRTSSSYRPR